MKEATGVPQDAMKVEDRMPDTSQGVPEAMEAISASHPQVVVVDWFVSGIANASVELTPDLWERMVRQATDYLMAGGNVPWDRWAMLDPLSREAFKLAASNLHIRSALERRP